MRFVDYPLFLFPVVLDGSQGFTGVADSIWCAKTQNPFIDLFDSFWKNMRFFDAGNSVRWKRIGIESMNASTWNFMERRILPWRKSTP